MRISHWVWPAVILLSAIILCLLDYLNLHSPARVIFGFWFMLICPGMAFVHLLRLRDFLTELVLAIALSLGFDAAAALVMVYSKTWSLQLGLTILLGITACGLLFQLLTILRSETGTRFIP